MKLSDHTDHIRFSIYQAVEKRLGRLGITKDENSNVPSISPVQEREKNRLLEVLASLRNETGSNSKGYDKLVDELTFTLFNRIAALKVMEAHTLLPEVITQRAENGNRSFAHSAYLENFPGKRNEEQEGLVDFLASEFEKQSNDLDLFSLDHYYHILPTAIELKEIIDAFNAVENDKDVVDDIWKSDDVLGWLYESYNNVKKLAHKNSKAKTEYDKVSIQSQVYTPKWVVKFLVDNSLGKQYLEMYPRSEIRNKYQIANAPTERSREPKEITEIKLIDPATGSGNFLLYAFDLFYDIYQDQIDNYGADYDERKIPQLIIENNLHGIDLDNRAIQIAQLGLYIKAKRKTRNAQITHYNVVSSDFVLPAYDEVKYIFNPKGELKEELEKLAVSLWDDLQQAHKFGSLIRIEEIVEEHLSIYEKKHKHDLFSNNTIAAYQDFRKSFIKDLKKAIENHSASSGHNFMNTQAENAVVFLEIMTQKYDVAAANPPYTDSADFGAELKTFIDKHYKKPYKFNKNLYASFIKRCCEMTTDTGNVAMIHPLTFMTIIKFEDVRKFILNKTHISLLVDYGLSNLFGKVMVDPAFYILDKDKKKEKKSLFISLDQYTRTPNEKHKKEFCLQALNDFVSEKENKHNIGLDQEKLKIIETWPFIYKISDDFREQFKNKSVADVLNPRQGIATGSNERCVRFWWEIDKNFISAKKEDNKKWKNYSKGGPYKKWYGNNWTVIDFSNEGYNFLNNNGNHLPSKQFYFQEACTYSGSGSKGVSFRYLEKNSLFDVGGSCIFMGIYKNTYYTLALLNSNLTFYIAKCFNPTVNTQVGDIKRLPFVYPNLELESTIENIVKQNIILNKTLNKYSIIEREFVNSYITKTKLSYKQQIFLHIETTLKTEAIVLFNEFILNELIFTEYQLSNSDRSEVEKEFGELLGSLPLFKKAKESFINNNVLSEIQYKHLEQVATTEELPDFDLSEFETLYNSNNNLEELCKRTKINPINIWYLYMQNNIIPTNKAKDITLEFITDTIRTLLAEDDDGIIPLYNQSLEVRLLDRLVNHLHEQGFSSSQIAELDLFLGKPLEKYLEENFFNDLANHLNLFMYLPKTPFIWHLLSGENKGFEAYISIYRWNRDSLFKLKSVYLAKRREQLQLRQVDLQDADTAAALAEKDRLVYQLQEVDSFETKLDKLIAEGYNPILDSGVGKNIAPLQQKGMLKAEVLNAGELKKYLNADW